MALATAMYHSGVNPLRGVRRGGSETVETVKGLRQRRLHKAFLRYHDPENWPLLREALKRMGRADLIGPGKHQLVPSWQPAGTGNERRRRPQDAAHGAGAEVRHQGRAGEVRSDACPIKLVRQQSIRFSSPLPLAGEGQGGGIPRHKLAARAPSPTLPRKREREQKSRSFTRVGATIHGQVLGVIHRPAPIPVGSAIGSW